MLRPALPPVPPLAPPDDDPPVEPVVVDALVLSVPPLAPPLEPSPPVADGPPVVCPPEATLPAPVPAVPPLGEPPVPPRAVDPPELRVMEEAPALLVPPLEPPLPPGAEVVPPEPPLLPCLLDEEPVLAPPLAWLEPWLALDPARLLVPPEAVLLAPLVSPDGELAVHAPRNANRTRESHEEVRMTSEGIACLCLGQPFRRARDWSARSPTGGFCLYFPGRRGFFPRAQEPDRCARRQRG